jgi:Bromodomain
MPSNSSFASWSSKSYTRSSIILSPIRSIHQSVRQTPNIRRDCRLIHSPDIIALNIPHYPKIVKKPMDLSTIQDKLGRSVYSDAKQFHADFKLMIKNCYLFNPPGTPVHEAGVALNEMFDEKWQELPSLHPQETDDDDEESDMDQDSAYSWTNES